MKNAKLLFTLVSVVVALSACSKKATEEGVVNQSSTNGSGNGTAVTPTTTFQVRKDFSKSTYENNNPEILSYLHRVSTVTTTDTDWSQPCEIEKAETDDNQKYIRCLLEVNELDLWFNNFDLNWGAAPGMCAYVAVHPYWFFRYQADLAGAADGASISYTVLDSNPPAFDVVAGGDGGGVAAFRGSSNTLTCQYDYTWMKPNPGPNCCEGTYNLTVTTCTSDPVSPGTNPPTCTASTSIMEWGGQYGNCASGPAATIQDWPRELRHNYPIGRVYVATDGVGVSLPIEPPLRNATGVVFDSVAFTSNYVDGAVPDALADVNTVQSRIGTDYVFICYDNNKESIARIDLAIRKWNTYTELLKEHLGDPTISGPETPFPGDDLDHWGWDDFVTNGMQYPENSL